MKIIGILFIVALTFASALRAELKLPAIISDHMVLQQKQSNPLWGWDTPGTKITVTFAGDKQTALAGADGKWSVKLAALPANAAPRTITIKGTTTRIIQDVLVGEVWMCSGQSNMQFKLSNDWNGDLEAANGNRSQIRLISVPVVGSQTPLDDFKGAWQTATPASARNFSAIGFLYGRYLHEVLGVPVGLINNSWGGSAAEAWMRRTTIEKDGRFEVLLGYTTQKEKALLSDQARTDYEQAIAQWKAANAQAQPPLKSAPPDPRNWLTGNARPGNIFNGMVHPTLGYGLKGVIWYQGENNAGRAYEYADLFPLLIEQWRAEWQQPDLAFYWVQLADFKDEQATPGESAWAELRESQTKALRLPHTGQAVIIDLGEGKDIHPRNKRDIASRLVRWALVQDYGLKFPYRSPEFKNLQIVGNKATLTIDCFGSTLRAFDVQEARGFAICGADHVWHWASGKMIAPNQVEVWSDAVPAPLAVRYAWADNPVCNLFSNDGLPVTPFRTDNFELTTKPQPTALRP